MRGALELTRLLCPMSYLTYLEMTVDLWAYGSVGPGPRPPTLFHPGRLGTRLVSRSFVPGHVEGPSHPQHMQFSPAPLCSKAFCSLSVAPEFSGEQQSRCLGSFSLVSLIQTGPWLLYCAKPSPALPGEHRKGQRSHLLPQKATFTEMLALQTFCTRTRASSDFEGPSKTWDLGPSRPRVRSLNGGEGPGQGIGSC